MIRRKLQEKYAPTCRDLRRGIENTFQDVKKTKKMNLKIGAKTPKEDRLIITNQKENLDIMKEDFIEDVKDFGIKSDGEERKEKKVKMPMKICEDRMKNNNPQGVKGRR
ncbi:hypothetical protein ACH5RR_033745 [Cinchona calisaya]|uniref:Uncharacterized protein n=1 Tax=Cinchona calisaya TaxID=153742 RepID=A0ABD2YCL9_9GENT